MEYKLPPIDKYNYKGIYCIKIDDEIVYVGQSMNIYKRVIAHMNHIIRNFDKEDKEWKYDRLRDYWKLNKTIKYDILYKINNKISKKELLELEKFYIDLYKPKLNKEYRNKDEWR